MPRRKGDENLFVKFYLKAALNRSKTDGEIVRDNDNKIVYEIKKSPVPVYDNVAYITIQIPGDKDCVPDRPAEFCLAARETDPEARAELFESLEAAKSQCMAPKMADGTPRLDACDVHRFLDEWEGYLKKTPSTGHGGMPLKAWAALGMIDPASVRSLDHENVYTVEQLAGLKDSAAGPFLALKAKAIAFLDKKKDSDSRAEADELRKQLAAMQEQLNQLQKPKGKEAR